MAAGVGVAPGLGCAWDRYIFLLVCASVLARTASVLREDTNIRVRRARQLALAPYLTSGILSCVAGALNPVGPLLILISAAAASFGGHSGLAWMWTLLKIPRIWRSVFQMPYIQTSLRWIHRS